LSFFSYIEAEGQVLVKVDLIPTKLRREDLPAGDVLCNHCSAKCCRYFALPIEEPTVREDWEFVRSYIIKDGHLFLALMADGGIYEFEPTGAAN
jgi:hypothetical protein